jgi:hypothetical protein
MSTIILFSPLIIFAVLCETGIFSTQESKSVTPVRENHEGVSDRDLFKDLVIF